MSRTHATTTAAHEQIDFESLPTLYRDRAFWGMTITQLLGAFNDNVFKQIVLLLCAGTTIVGSVDAQPVANGIFALAFVLFSGSAGHLADRVSKRAIIVCCKVAEIGVMAAGMLAFARLETGVPWWLLAVLFFMGSQSAVFGPAKYGILPEMVRGRDLPRFNGAIQMTTFVAILLGTALAGPLLVQVRQSLWLVGAVCVGIAALGTVTSLPIRATPVAQPDARFRWSSVAVAKETWHLLRADRTLVWALLVYSLFWLVGAVTLMTVNAFTLSQLRVPQGQAEAYTGPLLAALSLGVAAGCVLAGRLSHGSVRFSLVRRGAWVVLAAFLLMTPWSHAETHLLGFYGSLPVLAAAGLGAGMLAVPLQVYLQARPPDELKGRMIGTMNLISWIAIFLASGYYFFAQWAFDRLGFPDSAMFAATGLLLVPVAVFYRQKDTPL